MEVANVKGITQIKSTLTQSFQFYDFLRGYIHIAILPRPFKIIGLEFHPKLVPPPSLIQKLRNENVVRALAFFYTYYRSLEFPKKITQPGTHEDNKADKMEVFVKYCCKETSLPSQWQINISSLQNQGFKIIKLNLLK